MSDNTPQEVPPSDRIAVILESTAPPEGHTFTEQEVGDYKEQDRYLPVCTCKADIFSMLQVYNEGTDSKRGEANEERSTS
jgi:hypothetical protein